MKQTIQKLLIGASVVVGATAIASSPAFAASLTNVTVTGTKGVDYFLYERLPNPASATTDFTMRNDNADLQTIVQGSCSVGGQFIPSNSCLKGEPGGNVELFANSEQLSLTDFLAYDKVTSLTGTLGDESIILSSLTAKDWFGKNLDTSYGVNNFANTWFNAALTEYGINDTFLGALGYNKASLYNAFLNNTGFQKFSDPNISYVSKDDTGKLEVGLAGHFDATSILLGFLTPQQQQQVQLAQMFGVLRSPLQASEVVKITYKGETQYHYSFTAARSGLVEKGDGRSHTGLYDPQLTSDVDSEAVPEPSAALGLVAVGGLFVAKRKFKKA